MIFVAELMSGRDRHRPPLEPTPLFPFLKVGWFPCRDLRTCWRPKMWAIGPSGYTYSGLSKYKSVANTWVGRFTCPPPLGKLSGNMVLRPSGKGSLGGGSFHQTGVYCLICHRPPSPTLLFSSHYGSTTVSYLATVGRVCDLCCMILNCWENTIEVICTRLSESVKCEHRSVFSHSQ